MNMRYYSCCVDRHLGHEIDFDWLLRFKNLLLFLILFSLNNFNHISEDPTLLAFLIEAVSGVFKKKLVRFEINNTIVEGLELLYFITVLMLAQSLETQTLLSEKRHFYFGDPFNFGGLHNSIVKSFVLLVIIISVDDFEVGPRYIFRVLFCCYQLYIFQPEELLHLFHDIAQ